MTNNTFEPYPGAVFTEEVEVAPAAVEPEELKVAQTGMDVVTSGLACPFCGGASNVKRTLSNGLKITRERRCMAYPSDHRFVTEEKVSKLEPYDSTIERNAAIYTAYTEGATPADLATLYGVGVRTIMRLLRQKGLVT